jgi:hypothetical protein
MGFLIKGLDKSSFDSRFSYYPKMYTSFPSSILRDETKPNKYWAIRLNNVGGIRFYFST